jgi:hypothetical protein
MINSEITNGNFLQSAPFSHNFLLKSHTFKGVNRNSKVHTMHPVGNGSLKYNTIITISFFSVDAMHSERVSP